MSVPSDTSESIKLPSWEATSVVLPYRIGEVTLFSRRFRGLVLREHFFDLSPDPAIPAPPVHFLGAGIDVIVTRSHPIGEPLPALTIEGRTIRYVTAQYARCHTGLSGDFETYLAKFGAKTRNTLRRKVRRFLETGEDCMMREFKRPEEIEEFHRMARQVSAQTYQEKLLDAGIPGDEGFLGQLIDMAKSDSVRCYILSMEGRPIAYLCCPAVNGVLLYSYLGYDPKCADLSPGTVLQYLAFESLFKEKIFRAFDFTEGQGEHKKFFATHETRCADIFYFRKSASALFWVQMHRGANGLSALAGRALDRIGLKTLVKRFVRRL